MRKANIYRNGTLAGKLTEKSRNEYVFEYDDNYYRDNGMPPISLTLPKGNRSYQSDYLFPFFCNMLSEGVNKQLQCRQLKIAEEDSFGLLLATAGYDTIGPVLVKKIANENE